MLDSVSGTLCCLECYAKYKYKAIWDEDQRSWLITIPEILEYEVLAYEADLEEASAPDPWEVDPEWYDNPSSEDLHYRDHPDWPTVTVRSRVRPQPPSRRPHSLRYRRACLGCGTLLPYPPRDLPKDPTTPEGKQFMEGRRKWLERIGRM